MNLANLSFRHAIGVDGARLVGLLTEDRVGGWVDAS